MSVLNDLLRGIIEHPDDECRRLVYADALDETEPVRVKCPTCNGHGQFYKGNEEYNTCPEECAEYPSRGTPCDGSGTVLDTSNAARAAFVRNDIEMKRVGVSHSYVMHGSPSPRWMLGVMGEFLSPWEARYTRGFVDVLRCSAEDFIKYADALIWHPGQKCDGCYIGGLSGEPDGYTVKIEHQVWGSYSRTEEYPKKPLCRLCRGSRVRPCPATAQPIRKVLLTTLPHLDQLRSGEFFFPHDPGREPIPSSVLEAPCHPDDAPGRVCLRYRFPGIEFELPEQEDGTNG